MGMTAVPAGAASPAARSSSTNKGLALLPSTHTSNALHQHKERHAGGQLAAGLRQCTRVAVAAAHAELQPAAPVYPPAATDTAQLGVYVRPDVAAADSSHSIPTDDPWDLWPRITRRAQLTVDERQGAADNEVTTLDFLSLVLPHTSSDSSGAGAGRESGKSEGQVEPAMAAAIQHQLTPQELSKQQPPVDQSVSKQHAGALPIEQSISKQHAGALPIEQSVVDAAAHQSVVDAAAHQSVVDAAAHQEQYAAAHQEQQESQDVAQPPVAMATQVQHGTGQHSGTQTQTQDVSLEYSSGSGNTAGRRHHAAKQAGKAVHRSRDRVPVLAAAPGGSKGVDCGMEDKAACVRMLTARIAQSKSFADLQRLLLRLAPETSVQAVHMAALISRMRAFQVSDGSSFNREAAEQLISHMMRTWPNCVSAAEPGPAAVVLWAAAHTQLTLNRQLQAELLKSVSTSLLCSTNAQGKHQSGNQQAAAKPKVQQISKELTPEGLSNAVWAAGKLCPDLLTQYLPQLSSLLCTCLPLWSNVQLTAAVWGMSKASTVPPPHVSEALAEELWMRGPASFSPRELLTLVDAFANWGQTRNKQGQQQQQQQQQQPAGPRGRAGDGHSSAVAAAGSQHQQQGDTGGVGVPVGLQQTFMRMLWSKQLVWPHVRHAHSIARSAVWLLMACMSTSKVQVLPPKVHSQLVRLVCVGVRSLGPKETGAALRAIAQLRPDSFEYGTVAKQPGSQGVSTSTAGSLPPAGAAGQGSVDGMIDFLQTTSRAGYAGRQQTNFKHQQRVSNTATQLSRDQWQYAAAQLLGRLEELLPQQREDKHEAQRQAAGEPSRNPAGALWGAKDLAFVLLGLRDLHLPLQPSLAAKLQAAIQQLAESSDTLALQDVSMILSMAASLQLNVNPAVTCTLLLNCHLSTSSTSTSSSLSTRVGATSKVQAAALGTQPGHASGAPATREQGPQGQAERTQHMLHDVGQDRRGQHMLHDIMAQDQEVAVAHGRLISAGNLLAAVVKLSVQPPSGWLQTLRSQIQQDVQQVHAASLSQPQLADDNLRAAACQLLWALPSIHTGPMLSAPAATGGGPVMPSSSCLLWPPAVASTLVELAVGPAAQTSKPPQASPGAVLQPASRRPGSTQSAAPAVLGFNAALPSTGSSLHPACLVMLVQGIASHQIQPITKWSPQVWPHIASVTALCELGPVHAAAVLHAVSTAVLSTHQRQSSGSARSTGGSTAAAAGQLIPKRAVRSWPVATRKLLHQCQGLRQPAALLAGLLRLGLAPGAVWLGTFEAVVHEQLQSQSDHSSSNSQTKPDGAASSQAPYTVSADKAGEHAAMQRLHEVPDGAVTGTRTPSARDVRYLTCVLLRLRKEAEGHLFRQWATTRDGSCSQQEQLSAETINVANETGGSQSATHHMTLPTASHFVKVTDTAPHHPTPQQALATDVGMPRLTTRPASTPREGSMDTTAHRPARYHFPATESNSALQQPRMERSRPAAHVKHLRTVQVCRRVGRALLAYVKHFHSIPSHAFWQPAAYQQYAAEQPSEPSIGSVAHRAVELMRLLRQLTRRIRSKGGLQQSETSSQSTSRKQLAIRRRRVLRLGAPKPGPYMPHMANV